MSIWTEFTWVDKYYHSTNRERFFLLGKRKQLTEMVDNRIRRLKDPGRFSRVQKYKGNTLILNSLVSFSIYFFFWSLHDALKDSGYFTPLYSPRLTFLLCFRTLFFFRVWYLMWCLWCLWTLSSTSSLSSSSSSSSSASKKRKKKTNDKLSQV